MAKLDRCGELTDALLGSGNDLLVEGAMDLFQGAGMPHYLAINTRPDKLIGRNELGRLLTELRDHGATHCVVTFTQVINRLKIITGLFYNDVEDGRVYLHNLFMFYDY